MTRHTHTSRARFFYVTTGVLLTAIIAFAYFSTGVVQAAFGTLYVNGATAPAGMLWLPGPTGAADGNLWVSDHAQGFGRVDCVGGNCTFNALVAVAGDGQASFDATRNFVYVPDASRQSQGVTRYRYNRTTKTLSDPILLASGFSADRPVTCALSSNGNQLYIGFIRSGAIVRVNSPGGNAPSAGAVVANTSDGGGPTSMAMIGSALYLAEATGVARINSVSACTGGCLSASAGISVFAPTSLAYDGSTFLYIGEASNVYRYNRTNGTLDLYANQGTTGGGAQVFRNVSGLGVDPSGNLYIGDDPTAGEILLQGHVWRVAVGGDPLPPPPPPVDAASLYAGNITAPNGALWLPGSAGASNGNLWVADHFLGFGRVDTVGGGINPLTAVAGDGQPAFDASRNFVYVPDGSAQSLGIIRYRYNRTTKTLSSPVVIGGTLAAGRPHGCALAANGNTLYVSFLRNGNIAKITNPGSNTPTVRPSVAQASSGAGGSLALVGNVLYLAEETGVNRISSVSNCNGACLSSSAGILVFGPQSLVYDSTRSLLYIGDGASVYKYSPTSAILTTYGGFGNIGGTAIPFQNVSGLGVNTANGDVFAGDDATAGAAEFRGHVWRLPLH